MKEESRPSVRVTRSVGRQRTRGGRIQERRAMYGERRKKNKEKKYGRDKTWQEK